jgi:hypothetical protein
MRILELITAIEDNWPLLVFVFALGGAWWQGTVWFRRVNNALDEANIQHLSQNSLLCDIRNKTENLEKRIDKIEIITVQIHEELHDQEIKLAVLETTRARKTRTNKI